MDAPMPVMPRSYFPIRWLMLGLLLSFLFVVGCGDELELEPAAS